MQWLSSGRHVAIGTLVDDVNDNDVPQQGAVASIDDASTAVTLIQQEIIHIARGLKSDPWFVIIVVFRYPGVTCFSNMRALSKQLTWFH